MSCVNTINDQKLVRYAFQVHWLVEHVAPVLEAGDGAQKIKKFLERLESVLFDTVNRMERRSISSCFSSKGVGRQAKRISD